MEKSSGRKKTSLFARITRSVIALVVGLFLLTGVILGIIVYDSSYKLMTNELSEVSTAYTLVVEKELKILNEQVKSIAATASSMTGPLNSTTINNALDGMKDEYGFKTIYAIDKSGKTSTPGVTVNDRDYFISAMSGNFYTSSPFLKSDNTVGITVAVPIYRGGVIDGVASIGLPFDYFSKFIQYKIGKTGQSYIIDKTGTIVGHTDTNLVSSFYNPIEQAKSDNSVSEMSAAISNFIGGNFDLSVYATEGGADKSAVARAIPGTDGWVLVTTMNNSEINSTSVIVISILVGIVIAGVFIAIIAAMMLAKGISNPIKKINNRLILLSEGDLSSDIEIVHSGDEIETLSQSLHDTVMQLRMYILEISTVTQNMAAYNLDTHIAASFKGEFIPIKDSINHILQLMNFSFTEISQASNQVSMGADQVSQAAQALSLGAIQQSNTVEDLSGEIIMISNQVNENAKNATDASSKVSAVGQQIEQSNQQMQDLSLAMAEISSTSGEIGKIIKTIEDIAFQTNILALNAAVEAARAGAAGKGFAVVADEVRNLASKSAEAAKNTTALIESSIKAVKNGTSIADSTAKHLIEVVVNAKTVADSVNDISTASNEQATSIGRVTQGIDQISGVVQTNSATSEESAAASEELSGQATMLKELTDRFKLSKIDYTAAHDFSTAPKNTASTYSAATPTTADTSAYENYSSAGDKY